MKDFRWFMRWLHGGGANYRIRLPKSKQKGFAGFVRKTLFKVRLLFYTLESLVYFRGRTVMARSCKVRSRGEQRIADALDELGVKFVYEGGPDRHDALRPVLDMLVAFALLLPLYLVFLWLAAGYGMLSLRIATRLYLVVVILTIVFCTILISRRRCLKLGKRILHPDFWLPRKNAYIEYWGMVDKDPGYKKEMKGKQALYASHGVRVIYLYPSHFKKFKEVLREKLAAL